MLFVGLAVSLVIGSGCGSSMTMPAGAAGMLSTIQQKALALAAERALTQANLDSAALGKSKVQLQFDIADTSPNLAKVHVKYVLTERLRALSAGLADAGDTTAHTISCQIVLAGVDTNVGTFLLWRWLDTKAEVQLRFKDGGTAAVAEKTGGATGQYSQSWFMDFGPDEKFK
jgi:hypothetical protein